VSLLPLPDLYFSTSSSILSNIWLSVDLYYAVILTELNWPMGKQ